MKKPLSLLFVVLAATSATGAIAAGSHGTAQGNMPFQRGAPMQGQAHGGMAGMMDMMMQMHSQMMGGTGGPAMMGGGGLMPMGSGNGPAMMFGMATKFDANQDGETSPDELRAGLSKQFADFDADGNGSLSLAEFETLHSAIMREVTVDRFQFLDDDGDGAVTEAEMHAPANRVSMMQRLQRTPDAAMDGDGGMMDGQSGPMMKNN